MNNKQQQALLDLKEILLRMSYDVNKTLNENKVQLNEASIPTFRTQNFGGINNGLPLDYYYYDSAGALKTLPNLATKYPEGSTPAKQAYPNITKGTEYPPFYIKLNPSGPTTQIGKYSIPDRDPALNSNYYSAPADATSARGWEPQNLNLYKPVDYTYTSDKEPWGPKCEQQISMPGQTPPRRCYLPYASKRWKGGYTSDLEKLKEIYKEDWEEWNCNYGTNFDAWLCKNSGTIHKGLTYTSMALTVLALAVTSVGTGGLATPALAAYLAGSGLALDLLDTGLYVYEDNPREAVLAIALGIIDAKMLYSEIKGLSAIGATVDEINGVKNILRANKGKSLDALHKEGKLTKKQLRISNEIASGKNIKTITNLTNKSAFKLALEGAKDFMSKSPQNLIGGIISFYKNPVLKTTGLLKTIGTFGVVLDGVNYTYNTLYNIFSGEDEEIKSIMLTILDSFWPEVQKQVEQNNIKIGQALEGVDFTLESTKGVKFDTESSRQTIDSIKTQRIEKEKAKSLNSTMGNKLKKVWNLKSTGFKTEEEGNKFRKWFNERASMNSKLIDLDLTGAPDNSYIRQAYWTKMNDTKTYGDIYRESFIENDGTDDKNNDDLL